MIRVLRMVVTLVVAALALWGLVVLISAIVPPGVPL